MKTTEKTARRNAGFTLIEVMMASSLLVIVLSMLYGATLTMAKSARTQDSLVMLNQEARRAMDVIVNNLRCARASTLMTQDAGGNWAALAVNTPVTNIRYQRVADMNGNGNALDANLNVEVTQQFRFMRDTADANADSQTTTQLVRLNAANGVQEVVANHISPVVVTANTYSAPNGGILFTNLGGGRYQVTLILRHRADVTLPMMVVRLDQIVRPRN